MKWGTTSYDYRGGLCMLSSIQRDIRQTQFSKVLVQLSLSTNTSSDLAFIIPIKLLVC